MTNPTSTEEQIKSIVIRINQAYTEAHRRLGGSDESTIEERVELEDKIIAECEAAILSIVQEARIASVTRFELINHLPDGKGREKVIYEPMTVTLDIQDNGRTAKVFLSKVKPDIPNKSGGDVK